MPQPLLSAAHQLKSAFDSSRWWSVPIPFTFPMQTSHKPGKGWLIASHATAVLLGAAGVLVVNKTTERPVIIQPMLDLGGGEPIPLGRLIGGSAAARGSTHEDAAIATMLGLDQGGPIPLGRLLGGSAEARVSANENAAIATLRSITAAQCQLQASCAIDTDGDGGGEFGFFGELAGSVPLRAYDPSTESSVFAAGPDAVLYPPFLASAFGELTEDGLGHGVVERQGYYFKIYLPGTTVGETIPGLPESATGGTRERDLAAGWSSSDSELFWCAYAWPVTAAKTGNRAFFVNQEGDLVQYDNRDADYEGLISPPSFGAAYSDGIPDSMLEDLGLAAMGFDANDGNVWTRLGH